MTRVEVIDGPALLDSRQTSFVVAADRDGNVFIIDNTQTGAENLSWLLRNVADELESS